MHFEEKGVNILKKSGEKAKKWIIENSVMADEDNRNLDCGFSRGDKWFRFRVGAIIIDFRRSDRKRSVRRNRVKI